ncbi:hypothetical protein SUDANB145_07383 (plasmid) [Streptomyces sp. enrichment culture]|uniref:hypothetical protein n=1 Tax=Streptomyces sp. enrichment culture TaxID=1795815 RepID=UPI003F556B67
MTTNTTVQPPGEAAKREAQRLLALAHHFSYGDGADPVAGAALATEAQAHATLALVQIAQTQTVVKPSALTCPVCGDSHETWCVGCSACTHDPKHQPGCMYYKPPTAEAFVPQTERSYWVDIATALNAAEAVGMSVGIDLDGTLTDHNAWSVVWDRGTKRWTVAGYEDDESGEQTAETPSLTVYRASHDSIPMGLYTTAAEARKHCETQTRRDIPGASLDWIEDDEGDVAELVAAFGEDERSTGFVVTALGVAARYDEGADQ